ncbi:MAG: ABC transporter substrate-binding protein [Chloroflexia bacterium]|nr:ABC transporter substrate-binding protein [Chloroflexia bacterium]
MNGQTPERFQSRVSPVDRDLAARQWAEWRATRRGLLKSAGLTAGSLTVGGGALLAPPALHAAAQDGEPKLGGAISMSLADDDVTTFDPIIPFDNMAIWTMLLIYDQVIRVGPDGLSLEPGLAESWDVSDDGLTYTFNIRQANFHDGTPVTASDVAFCLNRTAFDEASSMTFFFSAVANFEATDEQTVVATLNDVWVPFEADLALFGASIYPQAAFEAQGDELWEAPIGSGPFMFESWERGAQIVLNKNPEYWDEGKPYLDQLTFKVLTDSNARMLQFQGGELDIVTDVPFNQIEPLSQNPDYVVLPDDAAARIDYIALNVTRAPLDDKILRQAINYAVDKDAIIQNVLFGAGVPATSYLPLMAGHDPDSPGYPFDLERARQLVAESNSPDGFTFELLTSVGDTVGSQVCQLVAAQLAEIGGQVTVTQLEPAVQTERTTVDVDYDASKSYYTTDIIDPSQLSTFAVLGDDDFKAVWTNYNNEEVDQLISNAQSETDPDARLEMYHQIQAMHLDDAPFIFLFYPTGRSATQSYVKNFHILPTGNYRLYETWRDDV